MVDEAGRWVPSVRRFPSTVSLCLYQLKLRPLARWLPPLRRYLMMDFDGSRPALIDQPMGAAFIMRRSDWETFGGLDEQFFLWFEEVDLACRVARVGGKSLYWPSIVVRHQEGTSFRQLPRIQRQRIWNRSMLADARRHLGRPQTFVLRATVPISLILAAVIDRLPPAMVDPHRKIAAAP